jgi:methylglutamate dehydrogenase subunit B
MRIPCPYCGERGSDEFSYLGDATVKRPAIASDASYECWMSYVYLRENPAGEHRELWFHAAGCRAWLIVTRNVRTHEILAARPAREGH